MVSERWTGGKMGTADQGQTGFPLAAAGSILH